MPIIDCGWRPVTWQHSVGGLFFSSERLPPRLLGSILIIVICGCAANTMPPATDDHRILTQNSDIALSPPSKGPIEATVTLTVYEDYQ